MFLSLISSGVPRVSQRFVVRRKKRILRLVAAQPSSLAASDDISPLAEVAIELVFNVFR
jgi:hypothetical protein